jgi:ribosomal protein S18 acetylase RimI-like enzyme
MSDEPLPQFARDYPAHFHIDLLPEAQSHGFGRQLIEQFCDSAKASGAGGVHLGVARRNTNAIGFYRHLGFREIAPDDKDSGGLILAKRLD